MFNPIRVLGGITKILEGKAAKLSDADIVAGMINLEKIQPNYDSETFDKICKKYTEYLKRSKVTLYTDTADFYVRVAEIAINFLEYSSYNIINAPDFGLQLFLPNQIHTFERKRTEIFDELSDFPYGAHYDLEQGAKRSNKELPRIYNHPALVHCSAWYYAIIVAIIIENDTKCTFKSLMNYMNMEIHDLEDAAIWQAIRLYKEEAYSQTVSVVDNVIPKEDADAIGRVINLYSQGIDRITCSELTMMEKCYELGKGLFLVNGINIDSNELYCNAIKKRINDFTRYILELKQ